MLTIIHAVSVCVLDLKSAKIPTRLNCWSNCKYYRSIDGSIHTLNKWRKANAVLFVALVISKNCFFPPQANFLNENPPNFVYNECMLVKKMYFFITEKHNFVPLNNPPLKMFTKSGEKKFIWQPTNRANLFEEKILRNHLLTHLPLSKVTFFICPF